jgi:CheY-like chemotaxis protein
MGAILLVDDDDVAREIVRRMIEREGYHVEEAADGQAAITALEDGLVPDCVVLDLMMPRVSGVGVLQRMRGDPRWRDIPVLLMTALAEGREIEEARAMGYRRHFLKAYWHVGELLQTLDHATGRRVNRSVATAPQAN